MPTRERLPHDLPESSLEAPDLVLRAPRAEDLETLVAIDASWAQGGSSRREYLRDRLRRGRGIDRVREQPGRRRVGEGERTTGQQRG